MNGPETKETGEHEKGIPVSGSLPDPTIRHFRVPLKTRLRSLSALLNAGEIDPWNINIIEVTDRFLTELERRRQLNLQVSGRTLFYAATLLRMKSEHLSLQS